MVSETGKVHSADISNPIGYVARPNTPKKKQVIRIKTCKLL